MRSNASIGTPNAFSIGSAISGDRDAFSFTTMESVARHTRSTSAAATFQGKERKLRGIHGVSFSLCCSQYHFFLSVRMIQRVKKNPFFSVVVSVIFRVSTFSVRAYLFGKMMPLSSFVVSWVFLPDGFS